MAQFRHNENIQICNNYYEGSQWKAQFFPNTITNNKCYTGAQLITQFFHNKVILISIIKLSN